MPSLTQGVRAALHRLVDLPRNSGHRLTHLPQHADTGVLLPATRLVCCSQGGLCLGKTQGCEVLTHRPGTHPCIHPTGNPGCWKLAGKAQGHSPLPEGPRAQATSSLAFRAADLPIRGWGQPGPTSSLGGSTRVTSPDTGPGGCKDSGVHWPVTHLIGGAVRRRRGIAKCKGETAVPASHSLGEGALSTNPQDNPSSSPFSPPTSARLLLCTRKWGHQSK